MPEPVASAGKGGQCKGRCGRTKLRERGEFTRRTEMQDASLGRPMQNPASPGQGESQCIEWTNAGISIDVVFGPSHVQVRAGAPMAVGHKRRQVLRSGNICVAANSVQN